MNITEISKGITHIEDLGVKEFLNVVGKLSEFEITEKVDGAQLLFGIDSNGFYTSREAKGGIRIYNEGDYGVTFSSTYMRSAHSLLEQVLPALKSAGLKPGDQVEAEVLYGELPNVVPYSADTNYLIFLRTTEGTVNIDRLKQKLDGRSVSVSLVSPFTPDGRYITLREETNNWKFARVPVIKNSKLVLTTQLNEMKKFLHTKDTVTGQTFSVILETPINKIPEWANGTPWKELKEHIREKKEYISGILEHGHILPIKEILLNKFVRNTSSSFGPLMEDGGWIEGVVLKHKSTGKMVKLVDKNTFGVVREKAWNHRNKLTESAKGINGEHSFMGGTLVAMATALGHPELGTNQAKNYLRKAGAITEDTLHNLLNHFDIGLVSEYWLALLEGKEEELEAYLDKYNKEAVGNSLFESAIRKRTLETFATMFDRIQKLKEATLSVMTSKDLFMILISKQLGSI